MGFRVQGLGVRVWGVVSSLEFTACSEFKRVQSLEPGLSVHGLLTGS